jgi:hypothetical protein
MVSAPPPSRVRLDPIGVADRLPRLKWSWRSEDLDDVRERSRMSPEPTQARQRCHRVPASASVAFDTYLSSSNPPLSTQDYVSLAR